MNLSISKIYLLAYNGLLAFGWFVILAKELIHLSQKKTDVYKSIELELKIFQTAAIFEIIHAVSGLVRSQIPTTIIQVFSRLFIVWAVVHSVKEAQSSHGLILCTVAWAITEIIRYIFYASSLLGSVPYFLLWLRYTAFIVLYPLGVTGELWTVVSSLSGVYQRKVYTFDMPNVANISFNYYYFLFVFMLLYFPLFPQLYAHMIKQRRKYLQREKKPEGLKQE